MAIREVLDPFCSISSQKVSQDKSRVYFSPNVSAEERAKMCDILGFHSTPSLGKYLGIPIKHSARTQDFGYIIERVQSRFAGWKSNLLSFAGRLVLTQVVTTTISNYAMQCATLSIKILNSINRLSRNFLWGSSKSKKKIHLVSWKKITKPKREAGLSIQATREKNIASLAKLNWHLQTESSLLWARVLTQKYRSQRRVANPSNIRGSCSSIWATIRKGETVFLEGTKWIFVKNSQLSLWFDKWLGRGPLRSLIARPLNRGEEGMMLKDVVSFSGWNWLNCSFVFPERLMLEMKATPVSFSAQISDHITWPSSPSGNFEL